MVHFGQRPDSDRPVTGNPGPHRRPASMRIVVHRAATVPGALAELAHRRFALALGRFTTQVRSLTVRLRDVNGPRGGHDQHCRVALQLSGSRRQIVVEGIDASPGAAIDRTAERAARAVARAVEALHDWRARAERRRR